MALLAIDDRIWFEDHAERFLRLRHPHERDGEPDSIGETLSRAQPAGAFVLMFCPVDGIHLRLVGQFRPGTVGMNYLNGPPRGNDDLVRLAARAIEARVNEFGTTNIAKLLHVLHECERRRSRLDNDDLVPRLLGGKA
ncbi:MAG: hypothetical protein ACT6RL_05030 [Neoaquamicrobium sediminum]|uniref:hypothetical protein n=1 Tax=Neoaquamicrobium sediminum TaxID=1849104 RepID=UPI0040374F07